MARITGIDDFTFLSSEAFLLVRPTGNFEVYTFDNPITPSTIPICQVSYAFPPLAEGYMYWYITMSSNPAPGSLPQHYPGTNPPLGEGQQIYYPNPNERIHACCLYIFNPSNDEHHDHRVHCFVFFVNLRTLLHPRAEWLKRTSPKKSPSKPSSKLPDADIGAQTCNERVLPSTSITSPTLPTYLELVSSGLSSSSSHSTLDPVTPGPCPQPFFAPHAPSSSMPPLPSPFLSPSLAPTPVPAMYGFSTHTPIPIQTPTHVPWAVWGPQSTRWFQECLSTDWQHSIYGLRTVESVTLEKMGRSTLFSPVFPPRRTRTGTGPVTGPGIPESNVGSGGVTPSSQSEPSASVVGAGVAFLNGNASGTNGNAGVNAASDANRNDSSDLREPPLQWRFIRLRDYNPYAVMECLEEQGGNNRKGKHKAIWNEPRVVTDPSTTLVKGVFKHDIVSCLPYVEVVSEEMFEVTDVMMDDCRLLLLRVSDWFVLTFFSSLMYVCFQLSAERR